MVVKSKILFFDVDTQKDFINIDGALYVPEADSLKSRFKNLIKFARDNSIPIWGSVDAHLSTDPELKRNGGQFPDHCMLGELGQEKIEETKPLNPLWVQNREPENEEIEKIKEHKGEVYFQKQTFNVFDNPAIEKCIHEFERIAVFGVATEYCVKAAVVGFLKRNKKVYLVTDAIKPVKRDAGDRAIEEMKKRGANFITSENILRGEIKF